MSSICRSRSLETEAVNHSAPKVGWLLLLGVEENAACPVRVGPFRLSGCGW